MSFFSFQKQPINLIPLEKTLLFSFFTCSRSSRVPHGRRPSRKIGSHLASHRWSAAHPPPFLLSFLGPTRASSSLTGWPSQILSGSYHPKGCPLPCSTPFPVGSSFLGSSPPNNSSIDWFSNVFTILSSLQLTSPQLISHYSLYYLLRQMIFIFTKIKGTDHVWGHRHRRGERCSRTTPRCVLVVWCRTSPVHTGKTEYNPAVASFWSDRWIRGDGARQNITVQGRAAIYMSKYMAYLQMKMALAILFRF